MATFLAPITKLSRAVKERGVWGTVIQLYLIGDLKFGEMKGTDRFGNKYFENLDLPYGQHRWVEYANIHDYDASMIPPEWHGWMHHVFDETPDEAPLKPETIAVTNNSNAIFGTHFGLQNVVEHGEREQHNLSQYRPRGYQVGSRMTEWKDGDLYYKQPGHPLSPDSDEGGRFQDLKNAKEWDPTKIDK